MRGNEIGIARVLGPQARATPFHEIAFEGALAINQRRDNVARFRFALLEHDDVAIENMRADHGVAPHLQRERFRILGKMQRAEIHRQMPVGLLRIVGGEPGRDGTIDRYLHHLCTRLMLQGKDHGAGFSREPTDDALALQRAEMTHRSRLAGESKMLLDVTCGGHDSVLTLIAPQKILQLLLPFCEHVTR